MLNTVSLVGRLTKDPEVRRTNTGKAVTSFSVACDRNTKEKQTDFFNVVAWGNTAEFVGKYINKGRLVAVDGRLQTRSYQNRDGNNVYVVEIVANNVYGLDKAKQTQQEQGYTEAQMAEIDDDDADLPF